MSPSRPKAFYLDRSVWHFGSKLENEMDKAENAVKLANMKRSARLGVFNKYMAVDPDFKPVQRFKDPAVKMG